MIVLTICNIIVFVNENTKIFKKKLCFVLIGHKRVVTLVIASVLWIVVLSVTLVVKGKELVWFVWIITSLCISGF